MNAGAVTDSLKLFVLVIPMPSLIRGKKYSPCWIEKKIHRYMGNRKQGAEIDRGIEKIIGVERVKG